MTSSTVSVWFREVLCAANQNTKNAIWHLKSATGDMALHISIIWIYHDKAHVIYQWYQDIMIYHMDI